MALRQPRNASTTTCAVRADIVRRVGQREKSCLELRWSEVDTRFAAAVKEFGKPDAIAAVGVRKRPDFATGKKKAEHRAESVENVIASCHLQGIAHRRFESRPEFFQFVPSVDTLQFT
jgi:hypothetical protein